MWLKLKGFSRVLEGRREGWGGAAPVVLLAGLGLLVPGAPAWAEPDLWAELHAPQPRFGLADEGGEVQVTAPAEATQEPSGPTPFLAGLMSAIVPGTGQLVQGQSRGWLYLGIEIASWFAYVSLQDAGDQALHDAYAYVGDVEEADARWAWDRYHENPPCGPGLGPRDFPAEDAQLQDLYDSAREDFYAAIGGDNVYACGWVDQAARGEYESMVGDADHLYGLSDDVVVVVFLNHLVSAVDAAKSASSRRKKESRTFSWQVRPEPSGFMARVQVTQSF